MLIVHADSGHSFKYSINKANDSKHTENIHNNVKDLAIKKKRLKTMVSYNQ